ncbi:MAG: hypothetical protein HQ567_03290, partial [Candidatus Nealsonbacteria bacterium]|nr:hypothetical protein [Candidatus Nealsonbacteria bacterium]
MSDVEKSDHWGSLASDLGAKSESKPEPTPEPPPKPVATPPEEPVKAAEAKRPRPKPAASGWNDLANELGVAPSAEPKATEEPVSKSPAPAEKPAAKAEKRPAKKERRPTGGFGAGVLEEAEVATPTEPAESSAKSEPTAAPEEPAAPAKKRPARRERRPAKGFGAGVLEEAEVATPTEPAESS